MLFLNFFFQFFVCRAFSQCWQDYIYVVGFVYRKVFVVDLKACVGLCEYHMESVIFLINYSNASCAWLGYISIKTCFPLYMRYNVKVLYVFFTMCIATYTKAYSFPLLALKSDRCALWFYGRLKFSEKKKQKEKKHIQLLIKFYGIQYWSQIFSLHKTHIHAWYGNIHKWTEEEELGKQTYICDGLKEIKFNILVYVVRNKWEDLILSSKM